MITWCEPPAPVPAGYELVDIPGGRVIRRQLYRNGLMTLTYGIETHTGQHRTDHAPLEQPGTYGRIVISRPDRYPTWEEMRDVVRTCGLFDRERDVFMVLPPDDQHVNVHNFAMHWFQEIRS